ncbi:MAG: serine hydrolase domain-containing protein [Gemmatimonadales bacterium]
MTRRAVRAARLHLAFPLALLATAVAPRAEAQRPWADLSRRFDGFAGAAGVVGGSAVLVRKGEIVARHHFGFADRAGRRRVTDRTIYHWASVTKTLTAIAVLQLRDRGLLALDDRVTRWVPELREIHDPEGWADSITIRMLLSHSSGLQSPTWPWSRGEPWEPFEPTRWEQLVAMMPYQRLHFQPGSRYGYSNPGYIYLARVIENLTGDPWAMYVQKNLWMPLRMDRSYLGATPYHLAADRSHGYRVDGDSLTDVGADFDPGITIPNSGWNAPLDDLARYVGFLTGVPSDSGTRARYDGVLRRGTLEEMWRPVVETGAVLPEFASAGLGFFSLESGGRRIVGHTGDQAGYRSYVYLDPAASSGVVLVFKTTNDGGVGDPEMAALAAAAIAVLR